MPHRQKLDIVDDVLKMLGLSRIQDSVVGDAEKRGISGGQRKRVNM
jgi:ABC-type multidrug transport system ATPase subunit